MFLQTSLHIVFFSFPFIILGLLIRFFSPFCITLCLLIQFLSCFYILTLYMLLFLCVFLFKIIGSFVMVSNYIIYFVMFLNYILIIIVFIIWIYLLSFVGPLFYIHVPWFCITNSYSTTTAYPVRVEFVRRASDPSYHTCLYIIYFLLSF